MNLYTYCYNDPVNFIDPTGHWGGKAGEFDDTTLSTADQNKIKQLTDDWYASSASGREAIHQAANKIRQDSQNKSSANADSFGKAANNQIQSNGQTNGQSYLSESEWKGLSVDYSRTSQGEGNNWSDHSSWTVQDDRGNLQISEIRIQQIDERSMYSDYEFGSASHFEVLGIIEKTSGAKDAYDQVTRDFEYNFGKQGLIEEMKSSNGETVYREVLGEVSNLKMVASTGRGILPNSRVINPPLPKPDWRKFLERLGIVLPEESKGIIDPKGTGKLDETYVTKAQLQSIYTNTTVTDEMITDLNRVLAKYGITDVENIQHFIAQTCIETGYGDSILEKGTDSYLNGKKYGKKYSGVGYIQMTWDYSYAAFSTYMILENNTDLKDVASYRNPKSNNRETIFNEYNKLVTEARSRGYNIGEYTDIVDVGRDYVANNYAWETAGYYWSTNGLTSVNNSTPVDNVTTIVNKWTDSYKARRDAYDIVIQYIK